MVELDVEARQGDSGGPIFNQRGQLAGVLFGAGQGTTLGSFGGRVQSFLATLAPDIGQRADDALLQAATVQPGSSSTNRNVTNQESALNRESNDQQTENCGLAGPASQSAHSMASQIAKGDPFQGETSNDAWKSLEQPRGQREGIAATAVGIHGKGGPSVPDENITEWRALAGVGWYEQAKSVLAAIGLLAIVGGVLRAVR
jgi:hypothetical protein